MSEASHGAFCFGLHICFERGDLGSQGTWLASRDTERSWEDSASGLCSETLVIVTFLLSCMEHWTTSSEEFFEFLLVKMNDQIFDSNRLRIMTVALRSCFLVAPDDRNRLVRAVSVSTETYSEE